MARFHVCSILVLIIASFCSCSNSSKEKDNPCYLVICDYGPIIFKFRLTDVKTGANLTFGPQTVINPDSVSLLMPDSSYKVKQIADPAGNTAYLAQALRGSATYLRVGRTGKASIDKLNFTMKGAGCCGTVLTGVKLNDSQTPLKQDSAGIYLIPYSLQ
ncbi:MAG TPA: hypothetical protein VM802_11065 [Chitinophaga sp.]|uniref:hypothetical protein n=1 Tax=Chitinophaga sp. TaxID=1869181 RepID=UPI002BBD1780|nr:hypothetical protein [Chitinophaga sp.]HVI45406.1 hypothetical protein [Chitinophaga sp.]